MKKKNSENQTQFFHMTIAKKNSLDIGDILHGCISFHNSHQEHQEKQNPKTSNGCGNTKPNISLKPLKQLKIKLI